MNRFVFFFCLFFVVSLDAQEPPAMYHIYIQRADSLYSLKAYKESTTHYSAAFKTFGWKGIVTDRVKAAFAWTMAGVPDSAFFSLERIAFKSTYSDYQQVDTASALKALHTDLRWTRFLERVRSNKERAEAGFNKPLIHQLDSLVAEDQKWRSYMRRRENKELEEDTLTTAEFKRYFALTDSLVGLETKRIFHQYGYPDASLVGTNGAHDYWLLVQHMDKDPVFQDSVLTQMKMAFDKKLAHGMDYAYLLDRIKVNTGQLQVYGSQMQLNSDSTSYEPKPGIEPERLNERRAEVGLPSEEEYIAVMNERFFGSLKRKKE